MTLSLQNVKLFFIELTKRVLSCSDLLPIKRRRQLSSFFESFSTTSFFTKALSKYFLIQKSTKFLFILKILLISALKST